MGLWNNLRELKRVKKGEMIGGVCGGLGAATPIPVWMWRAGFLFCAIAYGAGLLIYIVLWIAVPEE